MNNLLQLLRSPNLGIDGYCNILTLIGWNRFRCLEIRINNEGTTKEQRKMANIVVSQSVTKQRDY